MAIDTRARALIDTLRLEPHPEGGYFREIYRSSARVRPLDGREDRPAVTTIYFLLVAGQHSRWHRVRSEELWHFYDGEPLELMLTTPALDASERVVLGREQPSSPVHAVPSGWWQAARPLGAYSLVGCTVAPGFEYADFDFLAEDEHRRARLGELVATWASFA